MAQFVSKLLKLTKKFPAQASQHNTSGPTRCEYCIVHSLTPSQTLLKEAEKFYCDRVNIENIILLNRRKNQYQWLHCEWLKRNLLYLLRL